jgi:hypothetical protein
MFLHRRLILTFHDHISFVEELQSDRVEQLHLARRKRKYGNRGDRRFMAVALCGYAIKVTHFHARLTTSSGLATPFPPQCRAFLIFSPRAPFSVPRGQQDQSAPIGPVAACVR